MKLVHLALITATVTCAFIVDKCYGDGKNESIVVTAVKRRNDSDLYYLAHFSRHFACKEETFMVEERTCMKNEDLLKGEYMHNSSIYKLFNIN